MSTLCSIDELQKFDPNKIGVLNGKKKKVLTSFITVSTVSGTVDLVSISIAELGFDKKPHATDFMTTEFCARWSRKNLDGYVIELCQPEDGLQLCKQWKDQSKNTVVWMAMERLVGSDNVPCIFYIECDSVGDQWLHNNWVMCSLRWNLGYRIIFRIREIT